jgi:hypothetical protein
MRRGLKRVMVLLLLVVVAVLLIDPFLLVLPITLLSGWALSLTRLVKSWRPHPGSLLLLAATLAILIAGSHRFARWLHGSVRVKANAEAAIPHGWRWKWTLIGFGILFLTLLTIGSAILTTHQLFWLSRSTEPWFVVLKGDQLFLMRIADKIQFEAGKHEWDREKVQEAYLRLKLWDKSAWEEIEPVWVERSSNRLSVIVLVPRRQSLGQARRFALIRPGDRRQMLPLETLPSVLRSLGVEIPATNLPSPR